MTDSFRSRLRKGELLIGILITLPSPEIAEILAGAGFDWIWIDLEHSPWITTTPRPSCKLWRGGWIVL